MNFFIADDREGKMAMLLDVLKSAGWTDDICTATSSTDAIALIQELENVDAAFIDYYIPPENGPTIIAALRAKFPKARIALVSSSDNQENAAEATEAGANAVFCSSLPGCEERLRDFVAESL